eukprot:CAMPEP_0204584218 /NCGR_PEP_ID=MMETSP0661-20131031/46217_1 /ASSEMBLY_ACC=CAM_ASM_000606 /TAXON_ID=109239 /ORGANISM="Alexandrium margalefi, Strain AMGDE01CS-322" /LENGTH=53 /DNA_ID=CAMNT_0051593643 /DNA_START=251 /DNA_END=409 /DNA_ORIENTATION=-
MPYKDPTCQVDGQAFRHLESDAQAKHHAGITQVQRPDPLLHSAWLIADAVSAW